MGCKPSRIAAHSRQRPVQKAQSQKNTATVLSHHSAPIAGTSATAAAQKFGEQRDFKAPQALSGDTELTARAANVLNSVAKVQQYFETTKDLAKSTATVGLHNTNLIA